MQLGTVLRGRSCLRQDRPERRGGRGTQNTTTPHGARLDTEVVGGPPDGGPTALSNVRPAIQGPPTRRPKPRSTTHARRRAEVGHGRGRASVRGPTGRMRYYWWTWSSSRFAPRSWRRPQHRLYFVPLPHGQRSFRRRWRSVPTDCPAPPENGPPESGGCLPLASRRAACWIWRANSASTVLARRCMAAWTPAAGESDLPRQSAQAVNWRKGNRRRESASVVGIGVPNVTGRSRSPQWINSSTVTAPCCLRYPSTRASTSCALIALLARTQQPG